MVIQSFVLPPDPRLPLFHLLLFNSLNFLGFLFFFFALFPFLVKSFLGFFGVGELGDQRFVFFVFDQSLLLFAGFDGYIFRGQQMVLGGGRGGNRSSSLVFVDGFVLLLFGVGPVTIGGTLCNLHQLTGFCIFTVTGGQQIGEINRRHVFGCSRHGSEVTGLLIDFSAL